MSRHHFTLSVLFAALLACGPIYATKITPPKNMTDQGERIFDMPYLMRDLDNGLRVIVVKTDYPDIVTIQIPIQTGSRNEVEPGKSGFAHFFEHMMFRGTDKYPPDVYGDILKNAGADQNAYTTDDYTNYHITFTKEDLEKILELEADRFMNLKYSEELFRTEAQAVKGEYLKNYSNPLQKLIETTRATAFSEHTYKHTTMGFLEDIEDMPNQMTYAKTFFDRWYRPEKSAVILVGDVHPEKTFQLVKKYFGSWEPGSYNIDVPVEPAPTGRKYEHITWEPPTQPWFVMAFRGPAFDSRAKDMPAMDIISDLNFSETSDLYQKVVTDKQWADQFFGYFPNRKDPQLLYVAARLTDEQHADAVRSAIVSTIANFRTTAPDTKKLEETKSRLKYGFAAQMDNSETIGAVLAQYVQFERDPEIINRAYRRYSELTSDDILRFANQYFIDNGLTTVTLSNNETIGSIAEAQSIDDMVAALSKPVSSNITFIELPSASSPLVDVKLVFNTGAAFDPQYKKGLATLTALMIADGGSETSDIKSLKNLRYPMAADFSIQVDKVMTTFGGSVHKDNLDAWLSLALEQTLTPGWRQEDFDRIKNQLTNNIRTDLVGNNDEELGKELLYEELFGDDHPYGSLNLGHSGDIEKITIEDVKRFYQDHYTTDRLVVGLAGGYSASLKDALNKKLASHLPTASAASLKLPKIPRIKNRSATIIEKETPAVAVSFGFPLDVKRGDKDWVALWLARSWLGEHRSFNSHLFQRIREVRGMNYGNYAYIEYFPRGMNQFHPNANLVRDQQIFQVWIRPLRTNNDAVFATRTALYEMDKMIENGLTQEQFEATRNYLSKFVSLLVKTQSRQLGYAVDSNYYETDSFTDYVRTGLDKLTAKDVNKVIKKYIQTDNLQFIFVTKDAAGLKNMLESGATTVLEYNTPKPNLADEDAVIADYPLKLGDDSVDIIAADKVFE